MRETKISIVVPVYNAEKELQRCVDSIFRQSFSNWELLLIDDGSRDSSSALCDRLGAQDTRVRVWHKENGGVSSARNLGICKAEGEYLFFTDSDDTLFPDTLATLYQKAKVSGADLSVCGFTYLVEQTKECVDNLPEKAFCGGGKEYLEERFLSDFRREFFNPPWNKLIRRELLLEMISASERNLPSVRIWLFPCRCWKRAKGSVWFRSRCIVITIRKRRIW